MPEEEINDRTYYQEEPQQYTYKEVWDTLSKINVNDHTQKKNNMTYLSWTWAWQTLMEHYPEAEYEFHPNEIHPNGSGSVSCTLRIGNLSRYMWLPVMKGYKNTADPEPDARGFGDSRMRCLVKAMAMYGLGHYIYAGEDLPTSERNGKEAKAKSQKAPSDEIDLPFEEEGKYEPIETAMVVFLEGAETIDQLRQFWMDNIEPMKRVEKSEPARFERIVDAFKKKQAELSANQESEDV